VELKPVSKDTIEYTRPLLILGNVALFLWVILAATAFWFYNQIDGYLFLIFSAAAVYLVLRRSGCNTCAYCKSCTMGFGKLAGAFFGTGHTKKISVGSRSKMVAFIYFLLCPLPAAFLAISIVQAFAFLKVVVLVGLLAIAAYSGMTWRKTSQTESSESHAL
jgi:hypothetical protein